jgi:hypothetical protein
VTKAIEMQTRQYAVKKKIENKEKVTKTPKAGTGSQKGEKRGKGKKKREKKKRGKKGGGEEMVSPWQGPAKLSSEAV